MSAPAADPDAEEDALILEAERLAMDMRARCEVCAGGPIDREMMDRFRLAVCWPCKRADVTDNYKLITKTTARTDFLLTDKELDGLSCIEKVNPRAYSSSGPMKLYSYRQVEAVALKRFGSRDALQEEKLKRAVSKFEGTNKRGRQAKEAQAEAARASRPLKKVVAVHEHVFEKGAEICVDDDEGTWKKECTECGFAVLFEKL